VELLGRRWQTFVYADYDIDPERLETECRERGFRGYDLGELGFLPWNSLFKRPWSVIRRDLDLFAERGGYPVPEPFIALSAWNRRAEFCDEHGPERFTLWFIRLEAVTAYRELYVRRRVAPRCLVDVCPGLAFGGNYPGYREALSAALFENPAGLPDYLLHDVDAHDITAPPDRTALDRYAPVGRRGPPGANSETPSLALARLKPSQASCSLQLDPDHGSNGRAQAGEEEILDGS
jgi:hypothetical protein